METKFCKTCEKKKEISCFPRANWTWQIDHIFPQVSLPYTSMSDINFKKCWALENLRPLSAKDNFNRGIELLKGRKL